MVKKYIFSLTGINLEKIEEKYGIILKNPLGNNDSELIEIPHNVTKLEELSNIKKIPEIVSFLDESKRLKKCHLSMLDLNSQKHLSDTGCKYKCFWDKNYIPDGLFPIGCPVRYIPDKVTKSYHSEISKEKYTITESITKKRMGDIIAKSDSKFSIEKRGYYETDGVFCSFNCCLAYLEEPENKKKSIYRNSVSLLLEMYNDFNPDSSVEDIEEIMPAPHWRLLIDFGGSLTIEKFRDKFNKVRYTDQGQILFSPIGKLYEDQIKF